MTTDAHLIGITGATGRVGGRVARLLAGRGTEQRLLVRSPERAPSLPGADVARLAYENTEGSRSALRGVGTLLLVSAGESADRLRQHEDVIAAAVAAGVRHVVYTSFVGASPASEFTLARDHGATEDMLRAGGLAWTFLRDSFYQEAFVDFAVDGVIAGPAGQGRVAAVALDDVAGAAAAVLLDPRAQVGRTYDLTGPQALTLDEVAQTITRARGVETRYHEESLDEAYESRRRYGAPDWQLDAWVSTYTAIASGALEAVSGDVERITGRPAQSLAHTTGTATS